MSKPMTLPSAITAVQVFRRGATIVRHAVLDGAQLADAVPAEIELLGLPLSLIDGTAQVRVVEVVGGTVSASSVSVGIHVRDGMPPEKAPEQREIDDVIAEIQEREELLRLLDVELELLTEIPVPDRPDAEEGRAPPPAPLTMRLALEAFADDAAEARRLERRELERSLRDLHAKRASLEERVRAASTALDVKKGDLSKSLIVALRTEGRPTKVVLECRYTVPGATWTPAYQVKLARDGSAAAVHLRAHVSQRSGEDWLGVRLSLSTAAPLRFSELPELPSIRIGKAQPPPPKRGFRPPPKGGLSLFSDLDRDASRVLAAVPAPAPWSPPQLAMPPSLAMASTGAIAKPSPKARKGGGGTLGGRSSANRSSITANVDVSELAKEARAGVADAPYDSDDNLMDMAYAEESVAAPPPPAPAAAPMRMSSMAMPQPAKKMAARERRGPGASGVDDVVNALVFPLLRLPGPTDSRRGRLVPVDVTALYQDSAARFGRPLRLNVAQLVHAAETEAHHAGGAPPPMCLDVSELQSNFDFAYDADTVVDVVADGTWNSVPLGDRDCEARVRYVTVPREELAVYRIAVLQNPLSAPLLSGPAEVYVGGEYVLTTSLPTVSAKGEFTLGLGVEQNIKVARNARFKEVRDGEGVVAMVELVHDIDVEIVNHLPRVVDIEVRERVPVPTEGAEVQISERGVTPPWEDYDQSERSPIVDGGRRWSVKVDAASSMKLQACYVLRLFSNSEVTGGNRREQ